MRDAEGHQRIPLKRGRGPRRRGEPGVPVHVVMAADVYERVQQRDLAEDNRSLSRTIGHLLRDALEDDAITGEEARVILRALHALMADEAMADDVMDQIERLTEKLLRVFPELT